MNSIGSPGVSISRKWDQLANCNNWQRLSVCRLVTSIRLIIYSKFLFSSYIVGSKTAALANNWRWALRVTPILGIIAVVLLYMIRDPKRGASEGHLGVEPTSFWLDLKSLSKNYSFMLSTAGFTCVAFVAGALAWWGPTYIHLGLKMQPGNENLELDE